MDFIFGFLFGYFLKEIGNFIKRISNWDITNRKYYDKEWDFFDYDR